MQLSPYIRFAIDQRLAGTWSMHERIIFDYELLYVKEGEVLITVEDDRYLARPGDIFLFRPGRRHSMRALSPGGFRQPHLHFDLVYGEDSGQVFISFKNYQQMTEMERRMIRADFLLQEGIHLPDKLNIEDVEMFEQLLFNVIYEFESQMPFAEINVQGAFLLLWTFILRQQLWHGNKEVAPQASLMLEIRNFLNANTDLPIRLDDLSARYNISKFHLIRSFKEMFGLSPIHYHQFCRLEKAKNIVLHTNLSFSQIADALRFESLSTFTRAFTKQFGQPPSAFRRRLGEASWQE